MELKGLRRLRRSKGLRGLRGKVTVTWTRGAEKSQRDEGAPSSLRRSLYSLRVSRQLAPDPGAGNQGGTARQHKAWRHKAW